MRVAIVYVKSRDSSPLPEEAKAMAKALDGAGHQVELSDAASDAAPRLTGFDYVIAGAEGRGIGGKLPPRLGEYLAQAGMIAGKRSMAFVAKTAFGSERALARLMSAMEAEGMRVNCAEVVSGAADAARAALSAPIERY
jgi:menaquinone-dependent protoporphyrinogen IX oxidase